MLIFSPYTMQKSSIHILFQVSTEEIETSRRGSFKRGFGKDSSRRWHFSGRAFICFSSIGWESAGSPGTFQVLSLAPTKGLSSPLESDESYFQRAPDVIHILNDHVIVTARRNSGQREENQEKSSVRWMPPPHCCKTGSPYSCLPPL